MTDELGTCRCVTIRLEATRIGEEVMNAWVCRMCGREFVPRPEVEKIQALISDAEEDLDRARKVANDMIEVLTEKYWKATQ